MYSLFEKLLQERKETVANVARGTGIGESVFSNWKSRGGNLSVENLHKVSRYFGVSIEYFLSGEG